MVFVHIVTCPGASRCKYLGRGAAIKLGSYHQLPPAAPSLRINSGTREGRYLPTYLPPPTQVPTKGPYTIITARFSNKLGCVIIWRLMTWSGWPRGLVHNSTLWLSPEASPPPTIHSPADPGWGRSGATPWSKSRPWQLPDRSLIPGGSR